MHGWEKEITAMPAFYAMFYGGSDLIYWLTQGMLRMSWGKVASIL
jgi:hypothetical protein